MTSTISNISRNSASISNTSQSQQQDYLLTEDGGFLMQENLGFIILEQSVPTDFTINNISRS